MRFSPVRELDVVTAPDLFREPPSVPRDLVPGASRTRDTGSVVEVTDMVRRHGDILAVDRVSFSVRGGEIFGLLGPNGAGKTSSRRRVLVGSEKPESGRRDGAGRERSVSGQSSGSGFASIAGDQVFQVPVGGRDARLVLQLLRCKATRPD